MDWTGQNDIYFKKHQIIILGSYGANLLSFSRTDENRGLGKKVVYFSGRLSHQENMSVKYLPPQTPLLYSKTGICRGIPIFLIFAQKYRLWVLVIIAWARRF